RLCCAPRTLVSTLFPCTTLFRSSAPGELGLARAYVTGHLDVVGGVYDVIRALTAVVERLSTAERLAILRELGPRHLRWLPVPPEEAPSRLRRALHGIRHSKGRDSMAISRHYDVSNRFYELVLGPSMAYTCACYPTADADLAQAQYHKFDLVCRQLGLRPGMRLGDGGWGWGVMVAHRDEHCGGAACPTARRYGTTTTGTSARPVSTPCPRSVSPSMSAPAICRVTSGSSRPGCETAAGCSTTASPVRPPGRGTGRARSSTATSSPTASSRPWAPSSPPCRTTASKCATRR